MELRAEALVLYKSGPARVIHGGDKPEVRMMSGKTMKVRVKDVTVLHPGPIHSLSILRKMDADVDEVWELLEGETTNIQDLADLMFQEYSPITAWATWLIVKEDLYFSGTPEAIVPRPAAEMDALKEERAAKAEAAEAWQALIERVRNNQITEADHPHLTSVVQMAEGQTGSSRIMREMKLPQTSENAHFLLMRLGVWSESDVPYAKRHRVSLVQPELAFGSLPEEARRDLTHLAAFAIDDEDNTDPDDAISVDGDRLWVHVADVAALVTPGSELDEDARARGSNLYLPDETIHMLPRGITDVLGLGLQDISPALSIGMRVAADGTLSDVEITPSWVKVTRMSYQAANEQMQAEPFKQMDTWTDCFREKRRRRGSARIELPEVKLSVVDGEVQIVPLPKLASRQMVADSMLMAGEACARFALEKDIPLPFAVQDPPDELQKPETMAEMFAYRRKFKPSRNQCFAQPHAGLGLEVYTRATSPLRRYLDLVTHQQLRAFLRGEAILDRDAVETRIAVAEEAAMQCRRAERFSNKHWTLVYLMRQQNWRGEAILVDDRGKRMIAIIPELAMETSIRNEKGMRVDEHVSLSLESINLHELQAFFKTGLA